MPTALLLAALAGGVFTVDDDGPADFPDLAAADASPLVQDGDTLLVARGSYPGATLTKGLHVLAASEGGFRMGDLVVERVPAVSLVGAELTGLTLRDIPGTALVDRCEVFALTFVGFGVYRSSHTTAEGCDDLVLQRSRFVGADACYSGGPDLAEPAVVLSDTTAVLVDCELRGGEDEGPDGCDPHYPTAGEALRLEPGCVVVVTGSTLRAGKHWSTPQPPAIDVQASQLVVRGTYRDLLACHGTAPTIVLDASSSALVSGTALAPAGLPPGVTPAPVAEPVLSVEGAARLGAPQRAVLYGPRGALAVLALAPALATPRPTPLGGAGPWAPAWLDPAATLGGLVVPLRGQRLAAVVTWTLPTDPALTGGALATQAWVTPQAGAGPWVTNPVLVRPRP